MYLPLQLPSIHLICQKLLAFSQCFSFLFWTNVIQMVLLLRHLMSLVIESGFWFIESGVSIQLPVELVVYQHPASVSILPVIRILVSSLLDIVHPVGSLQLLVCCRGIPICRMLSVEARARARAHCDRRWFFGSRQLSRQCVAEQFRVSAWILNLMKVDVTSLVICQCGFFPLIANLSVSGCQCQVVSSVNLSVGWWKRFHLYVKSNEVQG